MARRKNDVREIAEILWEHHYTLLNTPVSAIRNIWDDFVDGTLYPWIAEEHDITLDVLLDAICLLTKRVTDENMNTLAIDAQWRGAERVGR